MDGICCTARQAAQGAGPPQSFVHLRSGAAHPRAWSAAFRFNGAWAIDLHSQIRPQAPNDLVEIRAEFRASGRQIKMVIQTRAEQLGDSPGHIPALSAFAWGIQRPVPTAAVRSNAALATLHWTALLSEG